MKIRIALVTLGGCALMSVSPVHAQQSLARAMVVPTCASQGFPVGSTQNPNFAPLTELPNGSLCTNAAAGNSSGGYTGATATAPGTNGTTATPVQGVSGGVPLLVNLNTLNGAALDSSVQAVKTALGNPFQAGASIGNTGFNALQAGAATSLTNPLFVQLSQGNAALSGSNGLPTTDTNAASTITAPGTAPSKSQGVQSSSGQLLSLDASTQAVKTALGTPFQAGGSIGNTAFGISGPIPAGTNSIGGVTEANGANVVLGNNTDAASCASGQSAIACFRQLHADLLAPTPAGTALIGGTNLYVNSALNASGNPAFVQLTAGAAKVGIFTTDQTTHGTTDKVAADLYVGGAAVPSSAYGTAPTGNVPGVNAFITNTPTVNSGLYATTLLAPSTGTGVFDIDKRAHIKTSETGSDDPLVGIPPMVSGSNASGIVVKASAGNLYGVYATCTAACWLMIFNSATVPADGTTTAGSASGNLQDCVPIASGGTGGVNYRPGPAEQFTVGIAVVISSTACATKTAAATGFIHGDAR